MKDTELVNELFELWKNLGEVGELHITKGYSDRLQMLQERVNKYNSLHNVSHQREPLIAFFMWTDDSIGKAYVGRLVDRYIESINCG